MIYSMEIGLIVQADSEQEALEKTAELRLMADKFDYENESVVELIDTYTEDQWRGR